MTNYILELSLQDRQILIQALLKFMQLSDNDVVNLYNRVFRLSSNDVTKNVIYGKPISKAEMDCIYEGIAALKVHLGFEGYFARFLNENKEAYYSE